MPGLPVPYRLRRAREFRAVLQDRQHQTGNRLLRALARTNGAGHARLGLSISKKYAPLASQRNRIKRQVREAFRAMLGAPGRFGSKPAAHSGIGLDIVVLATPHAAGESNRELRAAADRLFDKLIAMYQESS